MFCTALRDPKAAAAPQSAEEAAFDRARRELVFELRGAPADRTRTAEELAELERQRLEVRWAGAKASTRFGLAQ